MDSTRDASGVAATILIPFRFVWPYGGRSVYLCGSFTRWSELLQMSQVEGCPTVFQIIHSLVPGYHQYKFFVDGEWKHNEHQPYVSGEYGIVNTVLLTADPNIVPVLTPDIVSGSNMDVDNEAFRRMVRLTEGTLNNVLLSRISDADVQTSRQSISAFLSIHTAYELLPESGKVVTLDADLPVKQAFHILHEQGIPMAPLWDFCKRQFIGVLSALDFILILRELGNHGSNLTEDELETHTISAWKEGRWTGFTQCFIRAGPYDNLKEIAEKILQNKISTVPIIHSSSEDGSFPQLLHLASLSGMLKCICSDITYLAKDRAYTHINLDEMTVHQALQFGYNSYNPYELRSQRCHMCLRTDSLHKVMERLANPGVRRLVIVEAGSKLVEGIISLSDIFKFFLG